MQINDVKTLEYFKAQFPVGSNILIKGAGVKEATQTIGDPFLDENEKLVVFVKSCKTAIDISQIEPIQNESDEEKGAESVFIFSKRLVPHQLVDFAYRERPGESFVIFMDQRFMMAYGPMLRMPIAFDVGFDGYGMPFLAGPISHYFLEKLNYNCHSTVFDTIVFLCDFFEKLMNEINEFLEKKPQDAFPKLKELNNAIELAIDAPDFSIEVAHELMDLLDNIEGVDVERINQLKEVASDVFRLLPTEEEHDVINLLYDYPELYESADLDFRKPSPELLHDVSMINKAAKEYMAATSPEWTAKHLSPASTDTEAEQGREL